ncbi:MAG TPA: type IV toxin-antitoxin system AbiEi family antitoxin domain-containing protein [Sporichthya sp.]|nr:type IV toxin-antitoxin system AbiEi family antitoxin domain-containing protein [Sporichthya sp.]
METLTRMVVALAASQNGIISLADAVMCGYDAAEVERLCRRGEWTRLRKGLYAPRPVRDSEDRHLLELAAALRAVHVKDAAIAHLSAARLWGAKWLVEPSNTDIWVACDVPRTPNYYPGLRMLPAGLPVEDVTTWNGLPVSTPARTVVDLARHLAFEPAVVVVDSLRFTYKITDEQLAAVLERCRGWPFVRRARRAIGFSIMNAESPLESRFRIRFAEVETPPCRWQVEVVDANGEKRRLDGLFGRWAGLEIDGRSKYKTPEDLWEEKLREDALRRAGFPLLRLTAGDLRLPPQALLRRVINHMISTGDWLEGQGPVSF